MKEICFDLPTKQITGLAFGEPDKPLLVALHGWLDNAASFIPLSAHVSDYYVVALDLVGHGMSSHRPQGAHYHFSDFVQDLHDLISHNQWDGFVLLGHSMGGMIATLYAACFPEKINALICIESFGPLTEPARLSAKQLRDSIESRRDRSNKNVSHPRSLEHAVTARLKATPMLETCARLLMERNLVQQEGKWQWRTDPRLRTVSAIRLTEDQAQGFLSALVMPILIIRGKEGYDFILSQATKRSKWIKRLMFKECEGHHHLHMDNPREIAQTIRQFLNSVLVSPHT